jgi:hypothetical protein
MSNRPQKFIGMTFFLKRIGIRVAASDKRELISAEFNSLSFPG